MQGLHSGGKEVYMKDFQDAAGYGFKKEALLANALTHSSYANEKRCRSNERLEFLGDSVLGLIVSNYLYKNLRNVNEGDLSKIRASLVCEESLAKIAKRLGLGNFLRLGHGEELSGGRERNSILSDAFEAVLAAIYLDSDFKTAEKWVIRHMEKDLEMGMQGVFYHDYKTMLQEKMQKQNHGRVTYNTVSEDGPDHDKHFVVEVLANDRVLNRGVGSNKKEAEQNAAKIALENLGEPK